MVDPQQIFDSLLDGIITLDDDGRVININRAACQILEVERDQAVLAGCPCLLGDELCDAGSQLRDSIRNRHPIEHIEAEVRTTTGGRKILGLRTAVLRDDHQRPCGGIIVLRDLTELVLLRKERESRYRLQDLVGKSKAMQDIFRLIEEVADSDATVLIEGESGTGKELVARAIHQLSPRAKQPFVPVHCSALAESLLESELFGHVRGAFTGATRDKIGRFESAHRGTVFLDEIGEISPAIQVKLLRVLQERRIERVGDERSRSIDIRIIAATNRRLGEQAAKGAFRADLYYRLRVVPIEIPPLRERREDIPLLAEHFMVRFREQTGRPIEGIHPDAVALMLDNDWPGNIRQLENSIEYAFVKAHAGMIEPRHLPPELVNAIPIHRAARTTRHRQTRRFDLTAGVLQEALDATDWNIAKAARKLGTTRNTVYLRVARLGLRPSPG